ncbi:hypothetical protein DPMN_175859 [Dreissena polymorpha]|uniref:Uncharacterized protein n=1 Tax=Dreissena polymorpha TaxID=45954 RepID=A0A9D4E5Y3_DREPO|nr:hypothetical protein DPMN_175859 [Dreissena polymorpha]
MYICLILSGNPANLTRLNDTLLLDWADVFNTAPDIPHRYGLIIGSRDGHTDIADVAHLSKHVYDVTIPSYTLVSPVVSELFVCIFCTYSTGLSSMYKTKVIL